MPQVSVVIPTCNRPELLRRALRSVLAQTFQDFEVIVVDDGTESAAQAVAGFSDVRIRYVKNNGVHGGGASRNRGIEAGRGQFVAFLDDDDEWLPEKLETQIRRFADTPSDIGFSVTGVWVRDARGRHQNTVEDGIKDFSEIALVRFKGFLTSTLIIKRDVFDTVGIFDEGLPSHQEVDLIIRMTRRYKGLGVGIPLAVADMTPHEQIGSDIARRIRGREILIEKYASLFAARPRMLAKHYFWLGLWYRDSGNRDKARQLFWKAFSLSRNPRYLMHAL